MRLLNIYHVSTFLASFRPSGDVQLWAVQKRSQT